MAGSVSFGNSLLLLWEELTELCKISDNEVLARDISDNEVLARDIHLQKSSYHSEIYVLLVLPRWLSGKESTCQVGDLGSISRLERSPGGGNGNPLQYSCLGNPMDRGAWQATVYRVARVRHNSDLTALRLPGKNVGLNVKAGRLRFSGGSSAVLSWFYCPPEGQPSVLQGFR